MQKTVDFLEESLANIRAGKASVNVLNGVFVEYYGSQTPVSGVASVTVPDAKTILIQPWDKNMIRPIEKAIIDSNIGLTPSNNGESIRLSMPPLTEERRKDLVKQSKAEAENARVSLRNARRDAVEAFKKAVRMIGCWSFCGLLGTVESFRHSWRFVLVVILSGIVM